MISFTRKNLCTLITHSDAATMYDASLTCEKHFSFMFGPLSQNPTSQLTWT